MADTRVIFPHCVPDGDFSLGRVTDAEIVQQAQTYHVNGDVNTQSLIDQGVFDPDNVVRTYDCELLDGDGNVLQEAIEWEPIITFQNRTWRPGGTRQERMVPVGHSIRIQITTAVIRSNLMGPLLDMIAGGADVDFTFQAVYAGPKS